MNVEEQGMLHEYMLVRVVIDTIRNRFFPCRENAEYNYIMNYELYIRSYSFIPLNGSVDQFWCIYMCMFSNLCIRHVASNAR